MSPVVSFHSVEEFPGFDSRAADWFTNIVQTHGTRDVLEVGAGGNPTFSPEQRAALQLRYVANDVSFDELQKTGDQFEQWVCDLASDSIPAEMANRFDLVFSKMVNEHVADGRAYHTNIHRLLKTNGISAHCYPTLYALPFLINRLAPDFVSNLLVKMFMPVRKVYWNGKFKAYYSWSRGPSRAMIARFESIGFRVLEYRGYFGHGYYQRLPWLHILELLKSRFLASLAAKWCLVDTNDNSQASTQGVAGRLLECNPVPLLCSYGILILQKL